LPAGVFNPEQRAPSHQPPEGVRPGPSRANPQDGKGKRLRVPQPQGRKTPGDRCKVCKDFRDLVSPTTGRTGGTPRESRSFAHKYRRRFNPSSKEERSLCVLGRDRFSWTPGDRLAAYLIACSEPVAINDPRMSWGVYSRYYPHQLRQIAQY